MACVTHSCRSCPSEVFNNDAYFPDTCNKCGGDMHHDFDEPDDCDGRFGEDEQDEQPARARRA